MNLENNKTGVGNRLFSEQMRFQSTYIPDSSEFLWLTSLTGKQNAIQYGEGIPGPILDDNKEGMNLAYALIKAPIIKDVGGEIEPVNKPSLLIPRLALALVITTGGVVFGLKRRRAN